MPIHALKRSCRRESGASLITVLMVLVMLMTLGVAGANLALTGERSARNQRDAQIATQAAMSALADAELDLTVTRLAVFDGQTPTAFVSGCGDQGSGDSRGLCLPEDTGKSAWLTVDFTDTSASAKTVAFGAVTGRTFTFGISGVQPVQAPRYIIELITDTNAMSGSTYLYRVTAMGFGTRTDIQAVLQMVYRV